MNTDRFEIFRGREVHGQLVGLRLSGYAYQNGDEPYYRVKLLFLPDNVYYMSKNQGDGFTIFSKAVAKEDGKLGFQNPVGFARLIDNVKTHLYVRFPDLGSHMYMCLFPSSSGVAA